MIRKNRFISSAYADHNSGILLPHATGICNLTLQEPPQVLNLYLHRQEPNQVLIIQNTFYCRQHSSCLFSMILNQPQDYNQEWVSLIPQKTHQTSPHRNADQYEPTLHHKPFSASLIPVHT